VVEQIGSPDEIYASPKNAFVAEFMGEVNLLPIEMLEDGCARWHAGHHWLPIKVPHSATPLTGTERNLLIRPESLRFVSPGDAVGNTVPVRILNEFSLGSRIQYHVEVTPGCTLTVERLREERTSAGEALLGWEIHDSQVLEA
jgi:spermidine/putrescine transport system ATP-binding protein